MIRIDNVEMIPNNQIAIVSTEVKILVSVSEGSWSSIKVDFSTWDNVKVEINTWQDLKNSNYN
jgi:alpha-amylase/alpha-mannosidase (GH57 family)